VRLLGPDGAVTKTIGKIGDSPDGIGFDPGGQLLALWVPPRRGGAIVVRDETAGKELARVALPEGGGSGSGLLSGDGRRLLTVRHPASEVVVWDLEARREVRRIPVRPIGSPRSLGWSADGERIAWGHRGAGLERSLRVTDLTTAAVGPKEKFTGPRRQWDNVKVIDVTDHVITVEVAGERRKINYESDVEGEAAKTASLLPGGRVLVGANYGGLFEYNARTGKLLTMYAHVGPWAAPVPAPDGKLFLALDHGPAIHVYRAGTSEPVLFVLPVGQEWVAWTPAGDWAASPNGGELAGYLSEPAPGRLRTFTPFSADRDRRRPFRVSDIFKQ
jgi:hypothetical protein